MFAALADALVARLQEEQAPGGMLEEVLLVRWGDLNPIPTTQHPAVTVDWDGVVGFRAGNAQVELSAKFEVYLYTVSAAPDVAEREMQGLLWSDATGSPRGLLPALYRIARRFVTVDGQDYLLQLGTEVNTAAVHEKGHATAAAMIEVLATTMRPPIP